MSDNDSVSDKEYFQLVQHGSVTLLAKRNRVSSRGAV
jgi:hypothetical protein